MLYNFKPLILKPTRFLSLILCKIEPEDKRHGSPAASHSYFRKKPKLVTEYSYVRMLRI